MSSILFLRQNEISSSVILYTKLLNNIEKVFGELSFDSSLLCLHCLQRLRIFKWANTFVFCLLSADYFTHLILYIAYYKHDDLISSESKRTNGNNNAAVCFDQSRYKVTAQ